MNEELKALLKEAYDRGATREQLDAIIERYNASKKKDEAIPSPSLDGESVSPKIDYGTEDFKQVTGVTAQVTQENEPSFFQPAYDAADWINKNIPLWSNWASVSTGMTAGILKYADGLAKEASLFFMPDSEMKDSIKKQIEEKGADEVLDTPWEDFTKGLSDYSGEIKKKRLLNQGVSEERQGLGVIGNIKEGNIGTASALLVDGMIDGMLQSAVAATTGIAPLAVSAAGEKYGEIAETPGYSSGERVLHSTAVGMVEGMIEKAFAGDINVWKKALDSDKALKGFEDELMRAFKNTPLYKDIAKQGLEEGFEEALSDTFNQMLVGIKEGEEYDWTSTAESFLIGMAAGGGSYVATSGMSARGSEKRAKRRAEIIEEINKAKAKSTQAQTASEANAFSEIQKDLTEELNEIRKEDAEFYGEFSKEDITKVIGINQEIRKLSKKYNLAESDALKKKYADEIKTLRDSKLAIENKYSETPTRYIKDGKELSRTEFIDMLNAATPEELATGQWGVQNDEEIEQLLISKLPKETQEVEVEKPTTETKIKAEPEILVKNVEDQAINYIDPVSGDVVEGTLIREGQQAIVETEDKIIEIGNFEEIQDKPISELGIEVQLTPDVKIAGDRVVIRGKEYVSESGNLNEDVNYNKEGEVVSISLNTKDGKKRTFRGATAQEFVYQSWLQDNASTPEDIAQAETELQELIETDEEARNILTQPAKEPKQARVVTKDEDTQKIEGEKQQTVSQRSTPEYVKAKAAEQPVEDPAKLTEELQGQFGLLTAENPMAKELSEEENAELNKKAEAWLKERNYSPRKVSGRYEGIAENSFFVPNLTMSDAIAFAKEFNQDSVAHSEGLVDQQGKMYARVKSDDVLDFAEFQAESDFVSTVNTAEGAKTFKIGYNFKDPKVDAIKTTAPKDTAVKAAPNKKLQTMVSNFNKVIKKIGAQPYNITFAANNKEYEARYRELTGKEKPANRGTFIGGKREIIINLSSANEGTLAHEMMHAYLHALNITGKNILQLTNALYTELSTGSATEKQIARELRKFQEEYIKRNIYGQNKTFEDPNIAEEFLTEYVGIMVQYSDRIPDSGKVSFAEKIRKAVLKFLTKLGIKDKSILQAIETREEAVNFINGFVNVLSDRAGVETLPTIKVEKTANPYRAQRSEMEQIETPAGSRLFNDPLEEATELSRSYMDSKGLEYKEGKAFNTIDEKQAKRISDAFDAMKDDPTNPEVAAAYKALAEETIDQFEFIIKAGYNVEINNNEPYSSSGEMIEDLRTNKRMKIFSTESGFGDEAITEKQRSENPLLQRTKYKDVNGEPLLVNDLFRFVHDFFGHAKRGNGFGAKGEENAWDVHSRMYTPQARRAMTSETRGQNSYVNFSGVNDEAFALRDKARKLRKEGKTEEAAELVGKVYEIMKFADQKVGLLPDEFVENPYDNAPALQEVSEDGEPVSKEQIEDNVFGKIKGTEKISSAKNQPTVRTKSGEELDNMKAEDILGDNFSPSGQATSFLANMSRGLFSYKKQGKVVSIPIAFESVPLFKSIENALKKYKNPKATKAHPSKAKYKNHIKNNVLRPAVEATAFQFKEFMKANIRQLYYSLTPEFINASKRWYDGANRIANRLAEEYNISVDQSAGILAVLSPQNDWFNNIENARQFLEVVTKYKEVSFDQDLLDAAAKYSNSKSAKPGDSEFIKRLKGYFEKYNGMSIADIEKIEIDQGLDLSLVKANMVRAISMAKLPQTVNEFAPDGNVAGLSSSPHIWMTDNVIANAFGIYNDPENTSKYLGNGNKVRNFYNNIADPNSKDGYLTADTHALAVALNVPTSAADAGGFGLFGGEKSFKYALVKDAYIEVAEELGILPRQLQSVTWEAVRTGLNEKSRKNKSKTHKLINQLKKSTLNYDERAKEIIRINPSDTPAWARKRGLTTQKTATELRQVSWSKLDEKASDGSASSRRMGDLRGRDSELGGEAEVKEQIDFAGSELLNEFSWTEEVWDANIGRFGGMKSVKRTEKSDKPIAIKFPDGTTAVVRTYKEELKEAEKYLKDVRARVYPYADEDEARTKRDILALYSKKSDFAVELFSKNNKSIGTIKLANNHFDYYFPKLAKEFGTDYKKGLIYTADNRRTTNAVVVEPELRGKGYGARLYHSALRLLREQVPGARIISNHDMNVSKSAKNFWRGHMNQGLAKIIFNTATKEEIKEVGGQEVLKQLKDIGAEYTGDIYELLDPAERTAPSKQYDVVEDSKEQIDWERSEFGRGQVNPAIVNRTTDVQQAAVDLLEGKITNKEYQDTVKFTQAIEAITRFFLPASTKDMKESLDSNKAKLLNTPIEDGTEIGLRLDIPAYKNRNIWIVSVHDKGKSGKSISYGSVAWATDVNFGSNPKVAAFIAAGRNMDTLKKQDKTTIARMLGKWKNFEGKTKEERDAAAIKKVEEIVAIENKYPGASRKGSPWRQIGMNPFRHSFFYDRRNGKPVVYASEVVQIGGLVYAKDVEYADWSSDQFTVDGYYDADGAPVKFQVETQTDKKLVDALEKGEIPAPLYKKSLGEKIYAALFRTPLEMEVLKLQEKKDAKISDLEYQGREIANRIKRYAKTPEALKLANEYLTKEDKKDSAEAILKLPNGQKLLDNLRTARGFIDNISSQLANDPAFDALPDELRLAISENITTYLRAQYKFFTDKSYDIDKRRDPAIQAQFNELVAREIAMLGAMGASDMDIKQIINDSRDDIIEEATQMIDSYISDLKDVKYQPSTTGAGIKMPNAPFRAKKDLPQYIKELLGEEKNPVNRFAQTTKSLANVLYKGEMINGIIEIVGKDSDYILDEKPEGVKEKQYVKVSDPYSMLDGKYVHKEIMDMVNQKPLYTTDNFWANIYFTTLKLARKSKVIWNITTWRKNLTGGWYFIMANGVANPGFAKDFARRTKLMFNVRGEDFQVDEETKQLMRIMAKTGLTGKSIDANLIGISQAAFQFGLDGDENAYYERAKKVFNNIAKKDKWLQEKYAAVDDYTKLIIFRSEIQSYAKKLYGKAYDQLTDAQKDNVHEQAAERVKQSTPTFSRLPKWYPKVAVIPVVGDFISFRLESLRSYGENVGNAVSDLKKSQESGLDEVQKKEYLQSGLRRLAGSGAVFALKLGITTFLADLFLDDDDEELEEDAKVLRPEWMDGQTIIPRSIDKDGNVRVYNYSSEDPYGDVSDIFGGTESWSAMIKDFVRPNIAANLIFNLSKGEDIYGGKIADYSDSEINNMIKVLNYTAKQIVVPPTVSSSFRDAYLRSELPKKDKIVNLATTIAERSVIRDYKYNIVDSFVQDLRKIGETRKSYYDYDNPTKRLKQLDEIKEQFEAIVRIGVAKNNFELIDKAEKYMKRHLESLDEEYVLDGTIIKKQ